MFNHVFIQLVLKLRILYYQYIYVETYKHVHLIIHLDLPCGINNKIITNHITLYILVRSIIVMLTLVASPILLPLSLVTDQEMEGRAIDMLILSKGNSSTEEYVEKFLQHDLQKIIHGQQQVF